MPSVGILSRPIQRLGTCIRLGPSRDPIKAIRSTRGASREQHRDIPDACVSILLHSTFCILHSAFCKPALSAHQTLGFSFLFFFFFFPCLLPCSLAGRLPSMHPFPCSAYRVNARWCPTCLRISAFRSKAAHLTSRYLHV